MLTRISRSFQATTFERNLSQCNLVRISKTHQFEAILHQIHKMILISWETSTVPSFPLKEANIHIYGFLVCFKSMAIYFFKTMTQSSLAEPQGNGGYLWNTSIYVYWKQRVLSEGAGKKEKNILLCLFEKIFLYFLKNILLCLFSRLVTSTLMGEKDN